MMQKALWHTSTGSVDVREEQGKHRPLSVTAVFARHPATPLEKEGVLPSTTQDPLRRAHKVGSTLLAAYPYCLGEEDALEL